MGFKSGDSVVINVSGGGGGGNVIWPVPGTPQTFPPSEHNHDERYYRKEEVDGNINHVTEMLQGKVKAKPDDEPDYLQNKVDGTTIAVEGSELKVVGVNGMMSPAQINTLLAGAIENYQVQIDNLKDLVNALSSGGDLLDRFETYADLMQVSNKTNGDWAIVLNDEMHDDRRSWYVYSGNLDAWLYIGDVDIVDQFIALQDTPGSFVGQDGKVLRVDEANERVVFDVVRWSEIAERPSSTITQIDDAVSKRHDHSNKPALDRIGIIEQDGEKILTIDGIPYKPKKEKKGILSAYLGSTITVEENSYIKWNSIKPLSTIPYDSNTGLFTLTPGKSYKVIVSVMGAISNYITIHFARGTEKVKSAPHSVVYGATTVNNRGGSGVLVTTFTIGETSEGKYGILVGEIGGASSVDLFGSRTMLYIEEITDI